MNISKKNCVIKIKNSKKKNYICFYNFIINLVLITFYKCYTLYKVYEVYLDTIAFILSLKTKLTSYNLKRITV